MRKEHLFVCGLPFPAALVWAGWGLGRQNQEESTGRVKGTGEYGLWVYQVVRAHLIIGVVTSLHWNQAVAEGQRRKLGFLVNKHRETPTNSIAKPLFFSLPLPDFISDGGGG